MWMIGDEHSLIRVVAGLVAGHFGRFQDGNEWEWTISISRWFDGSFRFFEEEHWNHRFHWFSPLMFRYFLEKTYDVPFIFPRLTKMSCFHIFLWLSYISPIFWHSCPMFSHSFPMIFHWSFDQHYGFLVVPLFFHMSTCYFPIFPCSPIVFHSCSTDLPIQTSISRRFLRRATTGLAKKRTRTMYTTPWAGYQWESIGKIRKTDKNWALIPSGELT